MKNRNNIFHILYSFMVAFFVFIVLWLVVHNNGQPLVKELSEGRQEFSAGWVTEDGKEADLSHLNHLPGVKPYQKSSIFHSLPDEIKEGISLCFRSKNIFYQVYVGSELRYEPEVPQSRIYTESLGTRWNYVPIYQEDAGKSVEIRFYTVYDSARACVDYMYLGQASEEILTVFSGKIVSVVTSLLMLFVGFLLIVADIPINIQKQKNHELLYLGLFAVSIAIWCLSETNIMQFFTGDSRLMQLVSCCSLMLIPIPMVLYLDAAFGFRRHIIVSFVCYISAASFLLCSILHFSGILDYHETLTLTHIILAISALILLVTILRNAFSTGANQVKNVYKTLRAIGLMGIGFATGIDIVRYYIGNGGDSAMFVRIGLLLFILCYGSSSLEKTVNAVKLGVQSEFVSQLAYRDGLTGIGNRTAFQEHLVELEEQKTQIPGIAIIMFDVNDLKYVNDHMGHQKGDEMLVCSAGLIQGITESADARCYRIGGDEFAMVLSGENVKERCEDSITRFASAVEECNAEGGKSFRISIASGYAIYDKANVDTKLMDIYQEADACMYENKKQIKASQLSPEEYYDCGSCEATKQSVT